MTAIPFLAVNLHIAAFFCFLTKKCSVACINISTFIIFFFYFFVSECAFILARVCSTVKTAATNMPQWPVTGSCDVPTLTTKDLDSHFWLYCETRVMDSLPFNCHSFTDHHYRMWLISIQQSGPVFCSDVSKKEKKKKGVALLPFQFVGVLKLMWAAWQLCFSKELQSKENCTSQRHNNLIAKRFPLQLNWLFLVIHNRWILLAHMQQR